MTGTQEHRSKVEIWSPALHDVLELLKNPFHPGDRIGVKLHWGERGNRSFLPPDYAKAIIDWILKKGGHPFVFDTTVLYSGSRRNGKDSLTTASRHGYSEEFLGCPVLIADGLDGRDTVSIPSNYRHFETVQVANVFTRADGFVIFSHFKGHLASGFGGAIKNLSMGFASRAQKQRMHADVSPTLEESRCTKCGVCTAICPVGAACMEEGEFPTYDLETCIGCAQCIGACPEVALRILWDTDETVFQEKLVETAAAVWRMIEGRTILINALLNITVDCDCLPGKNPSIASDAGFITGIHPVAIDEESLRIIGPEPFDRAHPGTPWRRQFSYAREIGFAQ
ncbi:MAG: 4Fe-4S ferredoxin [Deltaproteobacteria bacterium HGW-Deltaproteobacteria-19]|jgi:hypothetical protein|nr:MAG: 4Fe-4S ferredoxin [Deltaproteobacteria bacterium HGW-Deltaproteobacteria-19]